MKFCQLVYIRFFEKSLHVEADKEKVVFNFHRIVEHLLRICFYILCLDFSMKIYRGWKLHTHKAQLTAKMRKRSCKISDKLRLGDILLSKNIAMMP